MKKIKIFIIEDHQLFRDGLKKILTLEKDLLLLGEAESGKEALALLRGAVPDIILLDLNLPDISGQDLITKIRGLCPEARVVILSMSEEPEKILETVKKGIAGYLTKSFSSETLVQSIRDIYRYGAAMTPDILRKLFAAIRTQEKDLAERIVLTGREKEILNLLFTGKTNKEIAVRLKTREKTIKNQLNHLYRKMSVNNRTSCISEAFKKKLLP